MSLLDELKQEASKRSEIAEKRAHIEALREQAQVAFKAQFLMKAPDKEKIAFLQGRLAAFDECLQLFMNDAEKAKAQSQRKWSEDEDN